MIAFSPDSGRMETHMNDSSRRLAGFALTALALVAVSGSTAWAQAFPSKPITLVVPTAAGGANDAMARIIAQGLSVKLGQSVIVDNKAGANGAIAAEFVARAAADGHTILFGYIARTASTRRCKNSNTTR